MKAWLYRLIQNDSNNRAARALKGFLWLLSFGYLGAVKTIQGLYRLKLLKKKSLPRSVISIGNLTLGGTGKTPLTGFVAEYLQEKGYVPAVLIRGYGAYKGVSDEVELYKELCPGLRVAQGLDRFACGWEVLKENPKVNVFVMDDGFQHWALDRDLEIVVIDATDPFGNGFLLPRGNLREPLASLRRADIIVLTKVDLGAGNVPQIYEVIRRKNFHAVFVESVYAPTRLVDLKDKGKSQDLAGLKGREAGLFSAIGNPQGFERTMLALGCKVQAAYAFPDHYFYTKKDLEKITQDAAAQGIKTLITTQKDAVKLRHLEQYIPPEVDLLVLAVVLKITKGEKEFKERLHAALRR